MRHVELSIALDNGYILTHMGYLAWLPLPTRYLAFPLRIIVLVLEATFTFFLWSIISRAKEYGMPVIRPWPKGQMEYDGLCTH